MVGRLGKSDWWLEKIVNKKHEQNKHINKWKIVTKKKKKTKEEKMCHELQVGNTLDVKGSYRHSSQKHLKKKKAATRTLQLQALYHKKLPLRNDITKGPLSLQISWYI